jgi:hypothetical protein
MSLRKLDIMHVRKVSSQISLCSPHRLIRDDTFRLNWIFSKKRLHFNENLLHRLIWDDTLRTSIMPGFLRNKSVNRLIQIINKSGMQSRDRQFGDVHSEIRIFRHCMTLNTFFNAAHIPAI